jgi:hypothetical protein
VLDELLTVPRPELLESRWTGDLAVDDADFERAVVRESAFVL